MSGADAAVLADLAGEHLDLVRAPFTLPRSRLMAFRAAAGPDGALRVHTSEYERGLEECRVLDALLVRGSDGEVLPVTRVRPHEIVLADGAAGVTFAGTDALAVGVAPGVEASVEWDAGQGPQSLRVGGRHAASVVFDVDADRTVEFARSAEYASFRSATESTWLDWFDRCPVVRDDLQAMAAFCWWVLGANIVELPQLGDARAVVPSKIGYVGLWQWDAYFIAVGLRHGDPALAREQLDLALRFPTADGQLPDVVHELGVLASSDDLPASDRETLRRAGSAVADPAAPVPLTKPPLTAWALRKVLEAEPADDWARGHLEVVRRSQDWWFAHSDLDGDGLPEYGHPYSSGLDDSPVFDGPLPTTSPDLAAFLVRQDLELADLVERLEGDAAAAARHRERAARTLDLLLGLWDDERGLFRARAAGEPVASDTIVGLMPLLTGGLPDRIRDRLVGALDEPDRFATPWAIPTVAVGDPAFSPARMWRGPVWVNANALVAEGLAASGRPDRARDLAEATVRLVQHGGGPHEYFDPFTGQRAPTATTAFGWSAALFIDLAVALSRGDRA
ncbi:amylo-alpha-1,6-glucosidase [Agromyces kandeliae]|uniref:Glycogen debranching protein n=1 Tax=Agromyces kandeliae TaxID=2666141 RepID=A0A6L5R1Q2_9MICO|nr:glycogen debranching protein [Agromyces kandeliae]MRX43825.1 glycogen debranching protein [Agromyces kandeliae]